MKKPSPSRDIQVLLDIMAALRDPKTGCPWDVEQTFGSITPYTIEETYEVVDAIERNDKEDLREELGDLLLQVVYYAQMAAEETSFDFGDVVEAITTKMIRRHPHVFGDEQARSAGMAKGAWERIKAEEKADRAARRQALGLPPKEASKSLLSDIPSTLPASAVALKLQQKAARVGFDWPETKQVLDKVREELEEVSQELEVGSTDDLEGEIGDLLFSVINLARHANIDPDKSLRRTNKKFRQRFDTIETTLSRNGRTLEETDLEEMEQIWKSAKGHTE